jgi:nickel-dependent lactate racemase
VDIPAVADLTLLQGKEMPAVPDIRQLLREKLKDPFGCAPLEVQAARKSSVTIVCADNTRNYAYDQWLPVLLDELNAAGIPDDNISLYVGSGTHRRMTDDEKAEVFSPDVISRVAVLDHDCDAVGRMKKIGRTDFGTVALVDERVWNSEMVIITGGINYHYFAGYSGGRKAILPGIAARESILHNHSLALDRRNVTFRPLVAAGSLVNNPVNEDMLQVAHQLRPDMCINVVLNSDREVAWLGVGDHGYMLRLGAQFLDEHNKTELGYSVDYAVIGAGGYPKDQTLFQAHKSLRQAAEVLKPGAEVFWVASCAEGEGIAEFQSFRDLSLDEVKARIQREVSLYSMCSLSLKSLAEQFKVHLVSELEPDVVDAWGLIPEHDLGAALTSALPQVADGVRLLVAPDHSNLLSVRSEVPEPGGGGRE